MHVQDLEYQLLLISVAGPATMEDIQQACLVDPSQFYFWTCKVARNIQCCVHTFNCVLSYFKTCIVYWFLPQIWAFLVQLIWGDDKCRYSTNPYRWNRIAVGIASYPSAIGSHCVVVMVIVVILFSREGAQRMAKRECVASKGEWTYHLSSLYLSPRALAKVSINCASGPLIREWVGLFRVWLICARISPYSATISGG